MLMEDLSAARDFAIAQVVPKLPDVEEAPHTSLFLPIHFRERFMGYVIMKDSRRIIFIPLLRARLINLSNSLESLRKQAHLQYMVEELDKRYVTDPLTGLYNRFGFNRYTTESFIKCVSRDESFMVLMADLDGLKEINDKYGHDDGDVAISAAAYILQKACSDGEICARIGGDEFVVYAEGYSEGEAAHFCKRLEKLIKQANVELQKPYQVSISYGYEVVYPEAGDTLEHYVDMADDNMYLNKKKTKKILTDNVRIFT
uniref:GGDEF domain-containing protein n=1 Tax=Acetatifactor sp. TaxID=1872090 RepID=UPI00405665AD